MIRDVGIFAMKILLSMHRESSGCTKTPKEFVNVLNGFQAGLADLKGMLKKHERHIGVDTTYFLATHPDTAVSL